MSPARRLAQALRNLLHSDRLERDLDDEIRAYVEMTADDLHARGLPGDEARRQALVDLGGIDQVKEGVRAVSAGAQLDQIRQDVRHALRMLRRRWWFTAIAIATLAGGIGATTAIFVAFNTALLRPLPYPDAGRLYVIHEVIPSPTASLPLVPVNALHFREWRAATSSFDELALIGPASYALAGTGNPVRVSAARATPNLFRLLGVEPRLGRAFHEDEDVPGRDDVVILSHELWATQFGADPGIIGRTVRLDGSPQVVVGVLPEGFDLAPLNQFYEIPVDLGRPRLWKPFAARPRDLRPLGSFNYIALGRLKSGVSPAQALEQIDAVQAELARRAPEPAVFKAALIPLADQLTGRSRAAMQLAMGTVCLVLLIACLNVTNLLLSQTANRHREFAVRRAAGASLGRLVRQMFTEALVLATGAGLAGTVVAAALIPLLRSYAPVDWPRLHETALDGLGLLFTFAITSAAGLLVGVIPAVRCAATSPAAVLRSSTTAAGSRSAARLRSVLVGTEVAGSVVCLIVAALLVTSFTRLLSVERGFDSARLVTAELALPTPRYTADQGLRFLRTLVDRARALPGVSSVGVTDRLPLTGFSNSAITVEGMSLPRQQRPNATIRSAAGDYFETMEIGLHAGRLLSDGDAGRRVAVISKLAAERLWPGQDPLGKRFRFGPDDAPLIEVVGVVGDVRGLSLSQPPALTLYVPFSENFYGAAAVAVKTADGTAVESALRAIIRELDADLAITAIRTMDGIVAESLASRKFQMTLVLLLGAAATFLAALGIYGLVAQVVAQRAGEFGIRMALGADARRIVGLVLGQGLLPVLAGTAAGILVALGVARFLRTLVVGVSPMSAAPIVLASVLLLLGIALLASAVPAWRAARIEPMRALRCD